MIEIPADFPRKADQVISSASHVITLPRPLSDALKHLSRQEDVTLFMTLLAGFKLLLYRYSGQTEIVVGSSIANRVRAEIEGLIGFFVNTLVLRTTFARRPSFRELLARVRNAAMGAYAHQDLPFEKLVEELQPERSLSHTPLFQVMFALQNQPKLSAKSADISILPMDFESGAAKFDLTLVMIETEQGLRTRMEYNAALFRAQTIHQMLSNFQTLLESAVADRDRPIQMLPMLSPGERERLVGPRNKRLLQERVLEECIHEAFAKQAVLTPDRMAVVFEQDSFTFDELNRRSNRLARYLESLGVGPDVIVGLYCERSLEMIVGLLGILKAGGAYLPLDAATPAERLAFMLSDTHTQLVVTQTSLSGALPEMNVVCLDADWNRISRESDENPVNRARAENLAYVIFTSGSTGRPKGVAVEHRQLQNYVCGARKRLDLPFPANYALVSTIAADLGHTMLFPSLSRGGTLHLLSRERATDADSLSEYFKQHEIDCLKIVPSHLATLMQSAQPDWLMPRQRLVLGGEAWRADWSETIQKLAPGCRIFNHYGPTETTVGVLVNAIDTEEENSGNVPLGIPMTNAHVYVLDAMLEPTPAGVTGEIYIGGRGVTRGYFNLPGATAEKFFPDPFADNPGERLYRTGDLARYLHNGKIEFLGRNDDQVKYHGYRIELNEIRNALKRHPRIRDGVLRLVKDKDESEVLVAYYVSRQEIEVSEIRAKLKEFIIEETLPSVYVHLRKLPLTLNGKVNYEALPSWNDARIMARDSYVAPRTPTETMISEVWCRLLNLQRVGVHDNFFEVGGHSLLATRLISQLREAFQVSLPLRNLFETPTVEGLAENIAQLWGGHEIADEVVRITQQNVTLPGGDLKPAMFNDLPVV